jgi:heme/copper-type cytochrome/quinol oxidase subunit 4
MLNVRDVMTSTSITIGPAGSSSEASASKMGFWSGLAAFASTMGYVAVQISQVAGALRFPLDEILIYGTSLCIVVPFVLEMVALHHLTPRGKQFWTLASLVFATMYAVFVTANYVVQLGTVIPAKIWGASEGIRVLEQTPHSLFWDYDAVGYICMGLATLFAVPALRNTGFERWVRMSFIANALVTPLIGIVYFYPKFSTRLLFLGFPWGVTAPLFMILLAILLRRKEEVGIVRTVDR